MVKIALTGIRLLIIWVVLIGLVYPLAITLLSQLIFPFQANGSLILNGDRVIGSKLIGQTFDDPKYFWGRPSAAQGYPYNAVGSSGSNDGLTNPALLEAIQARIADLRAADPQNHDPIPVDLVTASASGLDPQISLAAARFQASRVGKARGLSLESVYALIDQYTEPRTFFFLGEPRVNVLLLNMALDGIK
jgi:potassium-transporting ATPase KdpC subunit